jgi:hypothetical protein
MIKSADELTTTMDRIARFQQQVIALRAVATSPENYHASAAGYLAEIDRMMLDIRDYLWTPPATPAGELVTV